MGLIKNWIKMKIMSSLLWIAVHFLDAKIEPMANQPLPNNPGMPCGMGCCDYVNMAGVTLHINQIKAIEDEWVSRGIIG